jgi:hypothetical protein
MSCKRGECHLLFKKHTKKETYMYNRYKAMFFKVDIATQTIIINVVCIWFICVLNYISSTILFSVVDLSYTHGL